jgi:hypothetical protein
LILKIFLLANSNIANKNFFKINSPFSRFVLNLLNTIIITRAEIYQKLPYINKS